MSWINITVVLIIEIIMSYMLGRILIPFFRKKKTGKFDWYIGNRFSADGSEPKMGGVAMTIVFVTGIFTVLSGYRYSVDEGKISACIGAVFYIILQMMIGALDDYNKDFCGLNIGIKSKLKYTLEILSAICLLWWFRLKGIGTTIVLLPFRLGAIDLSYAYYFIFAIIMVIIMNSCKIHDCLRGNIDESIGGLCPVTSAVAFMAMNICCCVINDKISGAFFIVGSVTSIGMLIWGMEPSKFHIGESGGMFLGAVFVSGVMMTGLHLCIFLASAAFIADGVCFLMQYVIWKNRKKLFLKGANLHQHLVVKGMNKYKVMLVFIVINLVGGSAAVLFADYYTKFLNK